MIYFIRRISHPALLKIYPKCHSERPPECPDKSGRAGSGESHNKLLAVQFVMHRAVQSKRDSSPAKKRDSE